MPRAAPTRLPDRLVVARGRPPELNGHAPNGHPGPAPRGRPRRAGPASAGQPARLRPRTAADPTPRRLHRTRPPEPARARLPASQRARYCAPLPPLTNPWPACSPRAATAAPPAARPAPVSLPPTPTTSSAPASPAARTCPTPSAPALASSSPSPAVLRPGPQPPHHARRRCLPLPLPQAPRTHDTLIGTPLNPVTYDCAVLFNAHASALWARFTTHLRRETGRCAHPATIQHGSASTNRVTP
jgi:hypothetical protein